MYSPHLVFGLKELHGGIFIRAMSESTIKELEQLQNEKKKMLLEHETLKLKQREEQFMTELKEWRAQLKPRKQVSVYPHFCVKYFINVLVFYLLRVSNFPSYGFSKFRRGTNCQFYLYFVQDITKRYEIFLATECLSKINSFVRIL